MPNKFQEIYDRSIKNPEKFWLDASEDIFWFKKPTKILNKSNPPFYKWYEDGVTNTCYNALERCNMYLLLHPRTICKKEGSIYLKFL